MTVQSYGTKQASHRDNAKRRLQDMVSNAETPGTANRTSTHLMAPGASGPSRVGAREVDGSALWHETRRKQATLHTTAGHLSQDRVPREPHTLVANYASCGMPNFSKPPFPQSFPATVHMTYHDMVQLHRPERRDPYTLLARFTTTESPNISNFKASLLKAVQPASNKASDYTRVQAIFAGSFQEPQTVCKNWVALQAFNANTNL